MNEARQGRTNKTSLSFPARGTHGFTLLEVIITLVVFAILGAMLFTFVSTSTTRSHEPVFMAQDLATVQGDLEDAVAKYQRYLDGEDDWSTFTTGLTGCADVQGQGGMSGGFVILECTFSTEDQSQSVALLFSEVP